MARPAEHDALRARIRESVAAVPGVYRFLGQHGETVYIGKSVNLRERMLSYFGGVETLEPRIRPLVYGIHGFEVRETGGELLALLLEDALIKRDRPHYNVRQSELSEFRYLVLTNDRYPACRIVETPGQDILASFGPFRGPHFAAEMRDVVTSTLGLRACVDAEPFRRSARFDLGYCSGPCRGHVSDHDYRQIVERVSAFLAGDVREVAQRLRAEIARHADGMRFERAAELNALLDRCERFCARQRFVEEFGTGHVTALDQDAGLRFEFERGMLEALVPLAPSTATAIPDELREPVSDPRALLDRASLVHNWLEHHPHVPATASAMGAPAAE